MKIMGPGGNRSLAARCDQAGRRSRDWGVTPGIRISLSPIVMGRFWWSLVTFFASSVDPNSMRAHPCDEPSLRLPSGNILAYGDHSREPSKKTWTSTYLNPAYRPV